MSLPGVELENDAEDNPCFACGPRNPVGLRMRFFDDGARLRAQLTLDDRYSGYSGSVLQGILYAAMDDAIFWCAYARFGEMGTSVGDPTVSYPGRVLTGAPFLVEAWQDEDAFHASCAQDGRVHARMRWPMRRWSREEYARAADDPQVPRSVRAEARRMLGH